jgi:hypothetical protein
MSVGLFNEAGFAIRMQYLRAGLRLNSRVPVAVEWTESGYTHRVEGFTIDVSPKGCLAVVPQGFTMGQKLRLINLTNQSASEGLLIWRGHEGRAGWELGIELQNPSEEFWGLDF